MISLAQLLTLSGVVFALAVAGVFLNRKNLILLLMCVELLLLAANFNFIAFSRYLGDIRGQIFVFFVLTVAAAESAIGLALLAVPLLPLVAGVIAGLFGRVIGCAGAHTITIAGVAISCALSVYVVDQML